MTSPTYSPHLGGVGPLCTSSLRARILFHIVPLFSIGNSSSGSAAFVVQDGVEAGQEKHIDDKY